MAQLVALRQEEAVSCATVTDALVGVGGELATLHEDLAPGLQTDLATIDDRLATLHADAGTTIVAKLDRLHDDLTAAAPVSATVELGDGTMSAQDDIAAQLDGDLWIVCGVIVGCFAMGQVLKRVWP